MSEFERLGLSIWTTQSQCTTYRSRSLKLFHFTIANLSVDGEDHTFFCQILAQWCPRTFPPNHKIHRSDGKLGCFHFGTEFPLTHKVQSSANLLPTSMKSTLSLLQKSTHKHQLTIHHMWKHSPCGKVDKTWGMGLHPPGFHHYTTRGLRVVNYCPLFP